MRGEAASLSTFLLTSLFDHTLPDTVAFCFTPTSELSYTNKECIISQSHCFNP